MRLSEEWIEGRCGECNGRFYSQRGAEDEGGLLRDVVEGDMYD